MNSVSSIIYDFDGVILDSVSIKTQAFIKLYTPYGDDVVSYVVKYHEHHGGVSRYEKIAHYHQHLLGATLSKDELEALAVQFSSHVYEALLQCPFIPGAKEFITMNASRMPQMIASGSPQSELREICLHKQISQYFRDISGSPTHKNDIVAHQIERYSLNAQHTLMLGDSITDFEAASTHGLHFIQVSSDGKANIPGVRHAISDLMQLESIGCDE